MELAVDIIHQQIQNCVCFDYIGGDGYYGNDANLARAINQMGCIYMQDCQVDFNDIGVSVVRERAKYLDNIDIEALPTGGWGYFMLRHKSVTSGILVFSFIGYSGDAGSSSYLGKILMIEY